MLRHQPRTESAGRLAGSSKLLRAMNESATLAHLLDRGTLTRGDLRELTGLSKPTTSDVLRRLTDAGLAIVVGHTRGGPGPNAEIYAANPAAAYAVAVSVKETTDLARPEFTAALVDLVGTVHARVRDRVDLVKVDPLVAIEEIVGRLIALAGLDRTGVSHVHLGVPGSYDASGGVIRHIDIAGFDRVGLIAQLSERLGASVAVENDVNLAAIAERGRGVAAGLARDRADAEPASSFALLWFGEGLGLAIDLGGSLLRGARGGAGEIGYVPVGLPGQGPRDMQELVGGPAVVELAAAYGLTASGAAAAVTAAVDARSADAEKFLDELACRMGQCVGAVAGVLDPPLIVLAGEVAQAGGEELARRVRAAISSTIPLDITIAVTGIADDAVLLGAVDAGLRTVRDSLIDALRANVPVG
ncbi:MAG: ROK family transcriptional regulator [Hamadaea sp.]|uniref:ROK family transcriptional regulator n=1 Tax=Hamadaea sp. TaxID=2024425 RepID=UPI00180691B0|nr:ROK family transcriptional regulator [Hamadaea sp.]NUR71453.1 ROK family transcriptional regulator [Hamadaea sp.]NUT23951.1 ROK family transcriptional regulator [Hamadaea sp.]